MKKVILILFFLGFIQVLSVSAQRNVRDSIISTPWISVHYGANWSKADLADRYGFLNHIGFLAGYKTTKNWFWGVDANFIFGNRINMNDPLANLRDSKGNITDINGDIAKVFMFSRGFNANIAFGRVFPVLSPNRNSGIFVHGGVGYLAHKLRIETNEQVVPQVELDYKKGYDRLTIGPNLHQFVGYALMANRGFLNFYGGFYAQEGFTKNARTIFFDQPDVPVSTKTRMDVQIGFKVGWFIPIYKRLPKEYYFD